MKDREKIERPKRKKNCTACSGSGYYCGGLCAACRGTGNEISKGQYRKALESYADSLESRIAELEEKNREAVEILEEWLESVECDLKDYPYRETQDFLNSIKEK